jgi:hypothetical protein
MSADSWGEDARGMWQSQESVVTRMSADDMRARADRWNREFNRTNWIAFASAGVFLVFFVSMLVIMQTALQRLGAVLGIAAAGYVTSVGIRLASRRWVEDGATCVRAYKAQLERRRQADMGSARTLLLAMTGCAFLTSPGNWVPWTLQAAIQLGGGLLAYAYLSRQARRFQARIDELTRLEGD